jgi:hypothetical protein
MSLTSESSMRSRLAPLLAAAAVGVWAFLWLARLNPPLFPINDDAIRDQLMVRDCTDLDACHLLGALSSFAGLYHGAVWLDLLAAVRLLGGDVATERIVVLACLALTVATLFLVVWRWLQPSMALPATLLLLAGLSIDQPATLLINPSMAIFPDVLTSAGLLCYALSRRRRFLLLSAFALGLAVSMHTASFSLTAPFLITVGLLRPRWRDALLALVIAVLTYGIPSSAALRANVLVLSAHGFLLPMSAASLAVGFLAAALGARFRRCSPNARAWIIGAVMALPYALILSWLVLVQRHHFTIFYVHPILAPAAVAAAAILVLPFEGLARWARPLRWIPTIAVGVLAVTRAPEYWQPMLPMGSETWTLADAAILTDHAAQRGWTYGDLVLRLQGHGCRELLSGMSMMAPAPNAPPKPGRRQLQVVKAPPDALAERSDLVSLGGSVVLLREIESWLHPVGLKACHLPIEPAGAPLCSTVTTTPADTFPPDRFMFLQRAVPLFENIDRTGSYIATYEMRLAPAAGESREISLTDDDASACGWRMTRIEGVQVDGTLPARRVRLRAAGADGGLVVFEKSFGTSGCTMGASDFRYPPCVLETPLDDPLQDLMAPS